MATVTKLGLVKKIAQELDCEERLVLQAVDVTFGGLAQSVCEGRRIEIRGFGSWSVRETKPRNARNPSNGDRVFLPARRKVMYKPGKDIKEALAVPLE